MKKLPYILLSLLLTLAAWQASAQQISTSTINEGAYRIAGVKVTGAKEFDETDIISVSTIREGQVISIPDELISTAIKKLWNTKLFSDVAVYIDHTEGDNIYLDIRVKEQPVVSQILFEGITQAKGDDMIKETGLERGKRISDNVIVTTKNYLEREYYKKGFFNARAFVDVKPDSLNEINQNAVKVKVTLDKGERVKINSITFESDQAISSSKLRGAMKDTKQIKKLNFLKGSKYVEDKYTDDLQRIVEYYMKNGYRDARILSDTLIWNKEDNTLDLKIKINEGNQYHFRKIDWVGNTQYNDELLNEVLGLKPGDVYNGKLLQERIGGSQEGRDINTLYTDNGYLFANITPVEVNVENDSIDLEIRIFEGEKAYIDRVVVTGNDRSFDNVVFREITTKPGDLFSKTDIMRTQQKISALGYFDPENIGIDVNPDFTRNTVDITYSLVEKQSSQIELQAGWGGGQFIGTVGLSFNNFSIRNLFNKDAWKPLPMGDGQQLALRAQASFGYQSYSLSFTEPWIGGRRPISLSGSVYYTRQDEYNYYSNQKGNGRLNIIGGGFNAIKRLKWPDDYFTLSAGINYSRYDWTDYNWGLYQNFDTGKSNNLSLNIGLARRSAGSNPIFPMYGSDLELTAQFTLPYSLFNGKDYDNPRMTDVERFEWLEYYKIKFKGTWYNNIFAKMVLVSHLEFGYLGMYNHKVGLGPFERFEMGGSGMAQFRYYGSEIISLRGYADNSIGSSLAVVNAGEGDPIYNKFAIEMRYPITLQATSSVYALIFAEAGNTYADFKSYNPFDLHRSVGAGVRIYMPMFGMLGFDFGYGFDPMPGEEAKWEFHFTLGQMGF